MSSIQEDFAEDEDSKVSPDKAKTSKKSPVKRRAHQVYDTNQNSGRKSTGSLS